MKNPELRAKYSLRQMRPRRSNRSLRRAVATTAERKEPSPPPELENWQPKVLSVEGPRQNCWLVDSAADFHVCNDRSLMTEYQKQPTRMAGSTSNGTSPGKGNVRLRLALKDGFEGLMLNLRNVYYLPSSPCNLISLGLLINNEIFHDNERETLYQMGTKKVVKALEEQLSFEAPQPLRRSCTAPQDWRQDLQMATSSVPYNISKYSPHYNLVQTTRANQIFIAQDLPTTPGN